jgi:hypothetical protein
MRQPPCKLSPLKIPSAKDCIAIIVFLVLPGGSLFRGYAAPSLQFEFTARWFKTNYNFTKLIASGDYIFAGTEAHGWHVIDVSVPSRPRRVYTNTLQMEVTDMKANIDRLVVASWGRGIVAYDISMPGSPSIVASSVLPTTRNATAIEINSPGLFFAGPQGLGWDPFGRAPLLLGGLFNSLAFTNDLLFAGDPSYGLYIYSVEDFPPRLAPLSHYDMTGLVSVKVRDGLAFCAAGQFLRILDVSNPKSPKSIIGYQISGNVWDAELSGDLAYISAGRAGIRVLDISKLPNLRRAGLFDTGGEAQSIALGNGYIYVADGTNGIQVLKQTISDIPPLEITQQPSPVTVQSGSIITLTAVANGEPPLNFQWLRDGEPVEGQTNAILQIPNATKAAQGIYRVRVWETHSTEVVSSSNVLVRVVGGLKLRASPPPAQELVISHPEAPLSGFYDQPFLRVQMSTNLVDWNEIPEQPGTSGSDPNAYCNISAYAALAQKYFRVFEVP